MSQQTRNTRWSLLLCLGVLVGTLAMPASLSAKTLPDPTVLTAECRVGPTHRIDRLTVAPILGRRDGQVTSFTSLDRALASGGAIVQEVGTGQPAHPPGTHGDVDFRPNVRPMMRPSGPPNQEQMQRQTPIQTNQNPVQQIQQIAPGGGARVNQLEIINKGQLPILVLAGTIVKGGRQDRQIGQDFVIEPGKTVPVDAFCVERGRWNASRQGKDTAGKFEAAPILANQAVRAAGQYEQNQSMVWAKVNETNKAAKVETPSDTLSATLDNAQVVKDRTALAGRIATWLDGLQDKPRLVGLAYGLDGRPRAVRWFASPALFGLFRETLINTIAFDAVTTSLQIPAPATVESLTSAAFAAFVTGIRTATNPEQRKTEAGNTNVVWRTDSGYGSETLRTVNGKAEAITADFLAK